MAESLTDADLAEILACDVAEMRHHGHDDWALTVEHLVAEVRRLRALLADLVIPVEAFYWAMHDSRLLAPELDATLRTALAATRAAVGLPESP